MSQNMRAESAGRPAGPGEALDRRAVEADAFLEGAVELRRRDRDRLEVAEHIGEPQPHEADLALFECAKDELLLTIHSSPLSPGGVTGRLRRPIPPFAEPRPHHSLRSGG